jgi:hypothetical protein
MRNITCSGTSDGNRAGPLAADQGTQGSVRPLVSYLERYAAHRLESAAELLIDCEEDRAIRALLVGILREAER